MSDRIHSYESDDIEVQYDVKRCIHAAECVRDLPRVFDPNRSPWVDPDAADAALVAAVVECCPTGALHHIRKDGEPDEVADDENSIHVVADGPVYVRGDIIVKDTSGDIIVEDTRIALCRCGESANKPFCDRAHVEASFADSGDLGEGGVKLTAAADEGDGRLEVSLATGGPLLVRGRFVLKGEDGEEREGDVVALCRCGQSSNKPFCDGTHRKVDFRD